MPDFTEVGADVLENLAKGFQSAVSWFVSHTTSWWVRIESPNLEDEPAIRFLQSVTQPVTVLIAVLAMLVVAGKMALTRKANPLIDAGSGLVMLVTVTVIGIAVPNLLLQWGDKWATWVLDVTAKGGFSTRMTELVTLPTGIPAVLVIVLCFAALILGLIQAVLLLFRQGALVILAGMLPLAAAGMITTATRPWFKKVAGWTLALVFYKPLAALVYAVAFAMAGNGKDMRTVLTGFSMMAVSLVAFPVLLKFFTWTVGGNETGGGGGILGALIGGATAVGALRSYGLGSPGAAKESSANEHADYLNQQLGSQEGDNPSTDQQPTGAPSESAIPTPTGDGAQPPGPGPTTSSTNDGPADAGDFGHAQAGAPTGSGQPSTAGPTPGQWRRPSFPITTSMTVASQ